MIELKSLIALAFLVAVASAAIAPYDQNKLSTNNLNTREGDLLWWQTASFYQIYPRSFKDSDGDGVGDLKGITENLGYLKEIGITATWLSPIFASPMADFGYDISNFTKIDPMFGTMEDFEALMERANQLGLKIILDFVPNHTSDESEWFEKSVTRDPEFEDFFMWHPGKIVDGVRQAPSNWLSQFRGTAWKWNEVRQEYYLHQFADKQPDLNYRNPKVREYMNDVLRFWLKKGIAGFRIDAVPWVFEIEADANGNYPDEPYREGATDLEYSESLLHIYTQDRPETFDLVYEWRRVLDEFTAANGGDERILMIESWSTIEIGMQFYGNATTEGAQIPFNFEIIKQLTNDSNAHHYSEVLNSWLINMPAGRTPNWVTGNHDKKRVGTRMGTDRMNMFNILVLTLPGISVTYQGEEIGMTDFWVSWEDSLDPVACNSNPTDYAGLSRDPCRTPFQWSADEMAGFTSGSKTWLPVSDLYPLVNVKRERGIPNSHLNIYKQLQTLRSERTISHGDAVIKALSDNVLAVKRNLTDDATYITLLNIMDDVETVNLHAGFSDLPTEFEYVVVTEKSLRRKGDITFAEEVTLLPKEAVVLKSTAKSSASSYFGCSFVYLSALLLLAILNLC